MQNISITDCCWLYEQSEFNTDKISNFISNLIKDKTDYFIKGKI